jgi:membrane protease YdiL (CAAX protease family)
VQTASLLPASAPDPVRAFPYRTMLRVIVGMIIMRAGCVAAWAFFPRAEGMQQLARIVIPLLFVGGLVALNCWCLERDGIGAERLGLEFRRLGLFFAGAIVMIPVVLLMAGTLWLFVPFHWERGSLSLARLGWQAAEYTAGNFSEELMFRGYFLLVLMRYLGLGYALAISGILFGFFHLPGLSGVGALKMVCTTSLTSLLFATGFLLSHSLWMALGMHAGGNLLLHQGLGLSGGASVARVALDGSWPAGYDPAFVTWLLVIIPCAGILLYVTRRTGSDAPNVLSD